MRSGNYPLMHIRYNAQRSVRFNIQGERTFGPDALPLTGHHDLTARTHWKDTGYHVAPFLAEDVYESFDSGVQNLFHAFFRQAGLDVNHPAELANYHHYTHSDDTLHLAVVDQAKWQPTQDFPIAVAHVEERVSQLCGAPVRAVNPHNGEQAFHFRIVRPQQHDNNPFHRDVWLPEYHDAINIYVPLGGSNEHSSLTLVPGSHHWSEASVERTRRGAVVDGVRYNVPAVTDTQQEIRPIRPNPGRNEVLIFSPYLLHGGAVNLNEDLTRISLEMRFWA